MKNKNGSHVGFVISFVLFITFIVFVYVILSSRVDFGKEKENSLSYIKEEVANRVSGNLTGFSMVINSQNPQSCVALTDFFLKTGLGDRFVVRSDSGNVLQSAKSGNNILVERSGNLFFRAYGSEEFDVPAGTLNNCQQLSEGSNGYKIGFGRGSQEIFESKVLKLLGNYTQDYESLKKDMKISPGDEFGFRFIYSSGEEIKSPERNLTVNVYVDRRAVQYIRTDGTRESGFIDTIIW